MIHYHGTPIGGKRCELVDFFTGRHALVPWKRPEDMGVIAEVCRTFCLDNSAFSFWGSGEQPDWQGYYAWVEKWLYHPGFDFAIIPDVIDGTEEQNDELLTEWPWDFGGVPVWHLHESLERLARLVATYPRITLGSSGEYAKIKTPKWTTRMGEAFDIICDEQNRPQSKVHGLRMLDPAVFHSYPFSSCDSTNVARNASTVAVKKNCSVLCAREIIASRIEKHNSAATWEKKARQQALIFMGSIQ